jgi:hypothetical protein
MIRPLMIAILLFFLTPGQINAWWPFGPSNSDDCILKYQKEAKCPRAAILINFACNCKFKPKDDPLSLFKECNYNPDVFDCILDNIGNAQNDQAATAISQSCISKYNK